MDKLRFGTAGIPITTEDRNTLNGVKQVRNLGLDAMELEFVHSVNVSDAMAPNVKKIAEDNDVVLTCHGQYFVNLNALEKEKKEASIQRILKAARVLQKCGAYSLTYHMAYYIKQDPKIVYETVKKNMKRILEVFKQEGIKLWLRPEYTGKQSQFGDLKEVIKISQELDQVLPCIDYGHYHARYGGGNNDIKAFRTLLEEMEKGLGKEALKNMHIQIAGINYTEKGERNHLNLKESDLNYKDILKTWKEFNIKGVVIAETPNIEGDALLLQKMYKSL